MRKKLKFFFVFKKKLQFNNQYLFTFQHLYEIHLYTKIHLKITYIYKFSTDKLFVVFLLFIKNPTSAVMWNFLE